MESPIPTERAVPEETDGTSGISVKNERSQPKKTVKGVVMDVLLFAVGLGAGYWLYDKFIASDAGQGWRPDGFMTTVVLAVFLYLFLIYTYVFMVNVLKAKSRLRYLMGILLVTVVAPIPLAGLMSDTLNNPVDWAKERYGVEITENDVALLRDNLTVSGNLDGESVPVWMAKSDETKGFILMDNTNNSELPVIYGK